MTLARYLLNIKMINWEHN